MTRALIDYRGMRLGQRLRGDVIARCPKCKQKGRMRVVPRPVMGAGYWYCWHVDIDLGGALQAHEQCSGRVRDGVPVA